MERIYRKHMAIKLGIYLFSAQLMGGGVFCGFLILAKPKHSPFRCNKLTALPERRLMGWTRRSMKNIPLVSVGKEHGWIRRVMEQALGNEMELYWLFVRGLICGRNTAGKRNGMTAWIVEWSD
jgi:hypothetical protein